ncbi:MAG: Ppx/GppA phosphatase family protein [Syntrophomonadaceae bacterium]|nr:Ppx/GppA phosphatase family protein [Syntrophomonadaceae bacterium]
MNYAAIDIGTNSCRLLISSLQNDRLAAVFRKLETTRLGEGLNHSGRINPDALARTIKCLEAFRKIMQEYRVQAFRVVATSAVREAENRQEFLDQVRGKINIDIEVISGNEEAELSYQGVIHSLKLDPLPLVVDLGGGSTEFIIKGDPGFPLSLPVGAVRATESDMKAVEIADVLAPLREYKNLLAAYPLVLVGGTGSTLVAIKHSLAVYDPEFVHGQVLRREEIADIYDMLERMSLRLRQRLPGLQPERADIIPKGTMIVLLIMDTLDKNQIVVSESDLLEGLIWGMVSTKHNK